MNSEIEEITLKENNKETSDYDNDYESVILS